MLVVLFWLTSSAQAQNLKVDSQQSQLLLAASSTLTLQQELDKAGPLGFHAILGTTRGNSELVLLLERDVRAAERLQLRLISTATTGTFQKEISEAAIQGFRAAPRTFLNKPAGVGNEIVVVMERPANAARRYEYKILATNQTSTLESEWVVATPRLQGRWDTDPRRSNGVDGTGSEIDDHPVPHCYASAFDPVRSSGFRVIVAVRTPRAILR